MEINYNGEILDSNSQCLEMIPISLYRPKFNIKRKLYNIAKRTINIIAGIFGVILMVPVTIGIYIAQRLLNDKGNIFYRQKRIGKNRKIFLHMEI